jgi:hypothetical protein
MMNMAEVVRVLLFDETKQKPKNVAISGIGATGVWCVILSCRASYVSHSVTVTGM